MESGLSIKFCALSKSGTGEAYLYYYWGINKPPIMNTKIKFIEVGRFLICLGISWIAWMCMWSTGSVF